MNRIAHFLTSFQAVVLGLLIFVSYRYFEVQTLFYRYLPLEGFVRLIASILIALIVVFSLLLFSVHLEKFRIGKYGNEEWIKRTLFIFTLFINFFFWEAWQANASDQLIVGLTILFKSIIVLFFAMFDYSYNHLFTSLWNDKISVSSNEQKINQMEQHLSQINQELSQKQAKLSQIITRDDPKVCPRCGKMFENSNQRNGHLRSCKVKLKFNGNELQ